ncbi:hypothetical protein HYALB_00005051 [Hymenoscyphus albidus]|uniref:Uncharacterized protein n=1 Tax=Hymenoscyphus albidus TaxID=595503 RepID=A0A9N9LS47_9HELO|nr:hypothetical protein HYALB_00005051 [Hymenoscyphus albidus]
MSTHMSSRFVNGDQNAQQNDIRMLRVVAWQILVMQERIPNCYTLLMRHVSSPYENGAKNQLQRQEIHEWAAPSTNVPEDLVPEWIYPVRGDQDEMPCWWMLNSLRTTRYVSWGKSLQNPCWLDPCMENCVDQASKERKDKRRA